MTRIASVILCSCMLVVVGLAARPASAGHDGERYEVIVRPKAPHHVRKHVWYSSLCCYRKIVRHVDGERQVRYVRIAHDGDRPYVGGREPDHHHVVHRAPPRHEFADDEVEHHRKPCRHERVRVLTPGGGTAWAVRAACD